MSTIQEFLSLLLLLIPIAGGCKVVFLLTGMSSAEPEEKTSIKKQIKNILIFICLAEVASGVLLLVVSYFGGVIY